MYIDSHLHLDLSIDGTLKTAVKTLNYQLENSNIEKAIVLNMEYDNCSIESFGKAIESNSRLKAFVNINPTNKNSIENLIYSVKNLNYIGLKLHPRLQCYSLDDKRTIQLVKKAGALDIPVLIDAFPDGTHIMQGFSPKKYAILANECRKTNIIWAHMGGHYVLDFMMLAKRLSNVYMDCSYSLLYYQSKSITDNFIYSMNSMKFNKIFYGSDYPDRSIDDSLKKTIKILENYKVSPENIRKLTYSNAKKFFKW